MAKYKSTKDELLQPKFNLPETPPEVIDKLDKEAQDNLDKFEKSDEYAQHLLNNYALYLGQQHQLQECVTSTWTKLLSLGVPINLIEKRKAGKHVKLVKKDGRWAEEGI